MNCLSYVNKMLYYNIKNTTLAHILHIWILILSPFFTQILTINDPIFSREAGFLLLHSVHTSDQFPACYDSLPANLLVERDVIKPRLSLLFEYPEVISAQNIWRVFKLPVVDP